MNFASILKVQIVSEVISLFPIRAADITAVEYKMTREYLNKKQGKHNGKKKCNSLKLIVTAKV